MKFLHVYCENRKETVYVNLDKIVLITKGDDGASSIELDGKNNNIKVAMPAEELMRKINGEDKVAVGFRMGT